MLPCPITFMITDRIHLLLRSCGQKKKLVINGNKGSPEDGVIMEQNGDTVKSQEMVQLVSRDQTSDFVDGDALTHEGMRNAKDVDMKIGV